MAQITQFEPLVDTTTQNVPASWGNPGKFEEHYEDHAADFGATSWEDYANQANEFLDYARQNNLPMIEYPNGGEIGAYDPATNTFGVYNADGTTATFYKPTNPDYFQGEIDYVSSNGGKVINPISSNMGTASNVIPEAPSAGSVRPIVIDGGGGGGGIIPPNPTKIEFEE